MWSMPVTAPTARQQGSLHTTCSLAIWLFATDLQVHNLSERWGPGKLSSYWEAKVNVVMKRKSAKSPVYEVMCCIETIYSLVAVYLWTNQRDPMAWKWKWVKDTELQSRFKTQTKGQWESPDNKEEELAIV